MTIFDNYHQDLILDEFNNVTVHQEIWDTAGQLEYKRLRKLSYESTDIFIVCFSIVDRVSFENIKKNWIPELEEYSKSKKVATKYDLWKDSKNHKGKTIKIEEIEKLAKDSNCWGYFITSSLLYDGIEELFTHCSLIRCLFSPHFVDFKRTENFSSKFKRITKFFFKNKKLSTEYEYNTLDLNNFKKYFNERKEKTRLRKIEDLRKKILAKTDKSETKKFQNLFVTLSNDIILFILNEFILIYVYDLPEFFILHQPYLKELNLNVDLIILKFFGKINGKIIQLFYNFKIIDSVVQKKCIPRFKGVLFIKKWKGNDSILKYSNFYNKRIELQSLDNFSFRSFGKLERNSLKKLKKLVVREELYPWTHKLWDITTKLFNSIEDLQVFEIYNRKFSDIFSSPKINFKFCGLKKLVLVRCTDVSRIFPFKLPKSLEYFEIEQGDEIVKNNPQIHFKNYHEIIDLKNLKVLYLKNFSICNVDCTKIFLMERIIEISLDCSFEVKFLKEINEFGDNLRRLKIIYPISWIEQCEKNEITTSFSGNGLDFFLLFSSMLFSLQLFGMLFSHIFL